MEDTELEKIAQNLIDHALEAGGHDNITALVLCVDDQESFEPEDWILSEMNQHTVVKSRLNSAVDSEIKAVVTEASDFALDSPEPNIEELWTDVYAN